MTGQYFKTVRNEGGVSGVYRFWRAQNRHITTRSPEPRERRARKTQRIRYGESGCDLAGTSDEVEAALY